MKKIIRIFFLVTCFLVLVGLGVWQLERLSWKEGILNQLRTALAATPVAVATEGVQLPYTRVVIEGRIIKEPLSVYRQGKFHLVVPVSMKGYAALVDLGVDQDKEPQRLLGKYIKGDGIVRYFTKGFFEPANNPGKNGWYIIDGPSMELHYNMPLAPFYIEAINSNLKGIQTRNPEEVISAIPNNHLSYAITWFGLALAYVCVVGIRQYKKK